MRRIVVHNWKTNEWYDDYVPTGATDKQIDDALPDEIDMWDYPDFDDEGYNEFWGG